jgi:hypothetical protein
LSGRTIDRSPPGWYQALPDNVVAFGVGRDGTRDATLVSREAQSGTVVRTMDLGAGGPGVAMVQ